MSVALDASRTPGSGEVLGPAVPGPPRPLGPSPGLGADLHDPLLARLGRDPVGLLPPAPSPVRIEDAAGDLRAVAAAVRCVAETVASAEAATVGCQLWEGQAAGAQQAWAARVVDGCTRLGDAAARASAALDDLATAVAGVAARVEQLRAEATVAAARQDAAATGHVWARYADAMADAVAAEDACAAALARVRDDVPSGSAWTGAVLGLTGQQWRDVGRALGTVAWEAGPETAAMLLRYATVAGWSGLADRVLDAEDETFDRLVAWGGGHAGTAAHDSTYWVGTGILAVVPTPAGKPSAVGRVAGRAPAALRTGDGVVDGLAAAGRAVDDVGDWTGPSGLRLTAAQHGEVLAHLDGVAAVEPGITSRLTDVADRLDVDMAGLENRLKDRDSALRKVATDLADSAVGTSAATVAGDMNDAVRYTFVSDPGTYVDDVDALTRSLESSGFDPVAWDVRWGGEGYQGVNSTWRDVGTGQLVEVQFHTPDSHWAKEVTHPLYRERRLPGPSPERSAEVERLEDEVFSQVDVPVGVAALRDPVPPA